MLSVHVKVTCVPSFRRFFGSDGYHLTPYGFGSMLDYWMKTLVKMVNQADLPPSPEDGENGNFRLYACFIQKLSSFYFYFLRDYFFSWQNLEFLNDFA